ncbi:MAG: class B sortase [Clostridia bacterium]|nr:class B sortase [Clostridia bacterium]
MGHSKEKNKKQKFILILLILFIIIFIVSGVLLILKFVPQKNDLQKQYKTAVSDKSEKNLPDNPIDFKALKARNSEIIAWLTVPTNKTVIDYPIFQSGSNTEEDFYINHDIDRKSKKAGALYIQQTNMEDFSDFATIVYGHNMLNGTQFGTLKKFRNANYFKTYRKFFVYTPKHIKEYEIVSAFVYDDRLIPTAFNYFGTDEERQSFIDTCKKPKSFVKNIVDGFDVDTEDNLVVLSTCTSAEHERYLVVGKLIKDTKTK